MADKMMRVAGRSNEGLAKPLQTNTDGILKTQNDISIRNMVNGKGTTLDGWNLAGIKLSVMNPGYFEFKTDVVLLPFYPLEIKTSRKYYLAFDYFADGLAPTSKVVMSLRKSLPTADVSNGITLLGNQTTPKRESSILDTFDTGDRLATYRQGAGSFYYFKNLVLLDLTEAFGYGNEPSKEVMDDFMENFPSKYFSGIKDFNMLGFMSKKLSVGGQTDFNGDVSVNNSFAQDAPDGQQYIRVADIAPHAFDETKDEYKVRVSEQPHMALLKSHKNYVGLISNAVAYLGEATRNENVNLLNPIDVSKHPKRTVVIYNHHDQPIKLRTPFYFVDFEQTSREITPNNYGSVAVDLEIPAFDTTYNIPGKIIIDGTRVPFLNIALPALGLDLRRSVTAPTTGYIDVYVFGGK